MERHDRASEERKARAAGLGGRPVQLLVAILVLAMAGGCGGDDGGSGEKRETPNTPTSTATARPTQTSATTPTATASPSPSTPVEPSATSTATPSPSPSMPVGPSATSTATATPQTSPSPERCDVTDPCPAGELCELPVGVCASDLDSGTCVDVPFVCFDEIVPVCGCDGLTYGSDCLRRGARVQKAHDGPCPAEECGDDCDCYATRAFAVSCPLDCANCDSYWTCEDSRCIERCGPFPPDRCEALCFDNEPCGAEGYCAKAVGRCDGLGACRPLPEACPDVIDPVCGCDGETYSNECEAAKSGVTLAHRGPCEEEPTPTPTQPPPPSPEPCDITDPCPARQFCELPAGVCATDLDAGTCVAIPDFCFDPIEPVCGCDGLTYGIDCLRRAARVQKSADGPCPTAECHGACDCYATRPFAAQCPLLCPTCGNYWMCENERCIEHCGMMPLDLCAALCTDNEQCPPAEFCQKPVGQCDGLGACRPRPEQCPDVVDPVCGCDGVSYTNDCFRMLARVALAHLGPCVVSVGE
jgi:hypothetical protein